MALPKTAIITGGASGMGLAVAESLSTQGWEVHIFDLNASAGAEATRKHPKLQFTTVDVNSWDSLSSAFENVFKSRGRLDFVFANAGIIQLDNFYHRAESLPPPEPNQLSIDINLKAAINTCHLARQYFLANTHPHQDAVLVMTASIASFVCASQA
jgi:NAD(P)-dependent dehydrogenase (short-subunit alcohol dehydrogenase family)